MNAALRVLLFTTSVAIIVIFVALYRYGIFDGKELTKSTSSTATSTQTTEAPASKSEAAGSSATSANADLANGQQLYETKTCVMCHGADGKAQTEMGKAVKASDLTANIYNNKYKLQPSEYVVKIINEGVPGTGMVSFKNQIPNEKDQKDLAAYVVSLKK